MAFSTSIIGVAFLPLFTLTGVAGVIFSPMARTYAFAIGGAIDRAHSALTLTSRHSHSWVRQKEGHHPAFPRPASRRREGTKLLHAGAPPGLQPTLRLGAATAQDGRSRYRVLAGRSSASCSTRSWVASSCPSSRRATSGSERPCPMSISTVRVDPRRSDGCGTSSKAHPEVPTVVSQLGRPDDGTDVAGFNNVELFAPLKPFGEWPRGSPRRS